MNTTTTERRIKVANPFQRKLGILTPEQTAKVTDILHGFMGEIKTLISTSPARNIDCGMCSSCALQERTFAFPGFAATTFGVLWVLLHQSEFFVCHENQPGYRLKGVIPSRLEICKGFVHIVASGPERAEAIAEAAMRKIAKVVPEARLLEKLEKRPRKPSVIAETLRELQSNNRSR